MRDPFAEGAFRAGDSRFKPWHLADANMVARLYKANRVKLVPMFGELYRIVDQLIDVKVLILDDKHGIA